jgi:hypothetical protein
MGFHRTFAARVNVGISIAVRQMRVATACSIQVLDEDTRPTRAIEVHLASIVARSIEGELLIEFEMSVNSTRGIERVARIMSSRREEQTPPDMLRYPTDG